MTMSRRAVYALLPKADGFRLRFKSDSVGRISDLRYTPLWGEGYRTTYPLMLTSSSQGKRGSIKSIQDYALAVYRSL